MKKVLKYNLILVISLGLVFPGFNGLFAMPKETVSHTQPKPRAEAASIVEVVSFAPAKVNISVRSTPTQNFNCVSSVEPSVNNLVQDTALLNLNQPANCFSLAIGELPAARAIVVKDLMAPRATIVVVDHSSAIASFKVAASSSSPQLPIIPSAAAVVILTFVFSSKKRIVEKTKIILTSAKPLILQQLEVLRC